MFSRRLHQTYVVAATLTLLTLILARPAAADSDILIARDAANKLHTGDFDHDSGTGVVGNRVFGSTMYAQEPGEEFPSRPNAYLALQEPGFGAVVANDLSTPGFQPLPGGQALGFRFVSHEIAGLRSNLFYWNGLDSTTTPNGVIDAGDVRFTPAAPGHRLSFFLGGTNASVFGTDADVAGFTLQTTTASGTIHRHVDSYLDFSSAAPPAGIYLLALEFTMAGHTNSDPLFLVYDVNRNATDAQAVAMSWVQDNLVIPVPEPSGMILALFGAAAGAVAVVRRQRRGAAATFDIGLCPE